MPDHTPPAPLVFEVPGLRTGRSKGRPRFYIGKGGSVQARTPAPTRTTGALIQGYALAAGLPRFHVPAPAPVRVQAILQFARPTRLRRHEPEGYLWAPKVPDRDNVIKLILDNLQATATGRARGRRAGIPVLSAWGDDSQVSRFEVLKVYGPFGAEPRLWCGVQPELEAAADVVRGLFPPLDEPERRVFVPGEPVPTARVVARDSSRPSGLRVHPDPHSKTYKASVGVLGMVSGAPPLEGPVCCDVIQVYPRPEALEGEGHEWHTDKPDADNVDKAILDGLTGARGSKRGIAAPRGPWYDDAQVCAGEVLKVYDPRHDLEGGTWIRMRAPGETATAAVQRVLEDSRR